VADDLPAALEEIRGRYVKATMDAPLTFRVSAGDVPRLLAALEAALEHHQPVQLHGMVTNYRGVPVCGHDQEYDGDQHYEGDDGLWYCKSAPTVVICSTCRGDGGDGVIFPCGEYEAILAALTGRASDD
jgi:hypothetical protein